MSLAPAILDAMLAAGCTAEQIVAAVKASHAADEARKEAKRAGNAERQQRFRDRRKERKEVRNDSNALRDVTPPNDIYSNPPQSSPDGEACIPAKPAKRKSSGRSEMLPMPDGWEPVLTPAAERLVAGWPPGMFDRQLSAFRNHAADKGRKSKDWQAAFRTWIDNADKWKARDERHTISASNDEGPRNPYVRAVAANQAARLADERGQPGCWP